MCVAVGYIMLLMRYSVTVRSTKATTTSSDARVSPLHTGVSLILVERVNNDKSTSTLLTRRLETKLNVYVCEKSAME